jgi:hypothetical protein
MSLDNLIGGGFSCGASSFLKRGREASWLNETAENDENRPALTTARGVDVSLKM